MRTRTALLLFIFFVSFTSHDRARAGEVFGKSAQQEECLLTLAGATITQESANQLKMSRVALVREKAFLRAEIEKKYSFEGIRGKLCALGPDWRDRRPLSTSEADLAKYKEFRTQSTRVLTSRQEKEQYLKSRRLTRGIADVPNEVFDFGLFERLKGEYDLEKKYLPIRRHFEEALELLGVARYTLNDREFSRLISDFFRYSIVLFESYYESRTFRPIAYSHHVRYLKAASDFFLKYGEIAASIPFSSVENYEYFLERVDLVVSQLRKKMDLSRNFFEGEELGIDKYYGYLEMFDEVSRLTHGETFGLPHEGFEPTRISESLDGVVWAKRLKEVESQIRKIDELLRAENE